MAADIYIRDGASGSGDGSDWTNARTDITAGFSRGNTYWVADGDYGDPPLNTAVSGTTLITIKKATVADHGTETGWDDAYGDGAANFSDTFDFFTSYWVLDGQVGGGPGAWASGHGFVVDTNFKGIRFNAAVNDITVSHAAIYYSDNAGLDYPDSNIAQGGSVPVGQDGLYALSNASNITFSNLWFYRPGRTALLTRSTWDNFTVEYCYFQECTIGYGVEDDQHGQIWSAQHGTGLLTDVTIRYNRINGFNSTGGFIMSGGDGIHVYGNTFEYSVGNANGAISNWSEENETVNVNVHNNTFINCDARMAIGNTDSGNGWVISNNLWISNYNDGVSAGTVASNGGDSSQGTDYQTLTTAIFTNYASEDMTLASATNAGVTLSAPYNVDMLGNTRGADGTWDRGAFEFDSGGGGGGGTATVSGTTTTTTLTIGE